MSLTKCKSNSANDPFRWEESSATEVPTEMVQSPLALAQPTTPPSSLDLSQAIMDMQIPSGHAPKCMCSHTPLDDPSEAASTDLCPPTPCHSFPTHQLLQQTVTSEHVQQFLDILKSLSTKQGSPPESPNSVKEAGGKKPDAREQPETPPASKLEFKTVNEVYVSNGVIKIWLTVHLGGMRKNLNIRFKNLQRRK
jgi:hypothetical protein